MTKKMAIVEGTHFENLIREVRGRKVMLDADLAWVYGVETRVLNQAVKRSIGKFPADFAFQLTKGEMNSILRLKSQSVTSNRRGGRRKLPCVFTEHGAIMAANVLRSPRAVQMSVFVVRAFVRMRSVLADSRVLAPKLAALEKELKDRLDVHEAAILTILQRVMDILDPPPLPEPRRRRIGFR